MMMNQDNENGSWEPSNSSILVFSFLQNSSNCIFASELDDLGNQLLTPKFRSWAADFDEGELQTDGNTCARPQVTDREEEMFREIGAQLAKIGDRLAADIEPSMVDHLVRQFMEENLSVETITRHLSQAVEELSRRMPLDMPQERAMLVIAMVLAKNVANTVPSLLHRVFSTTVNYINHNLQEYVNNLEL
ncbi:BH3-interacting domain death agonist isoform X2 [Hemicordylus capensis]|nr:BH3-interacting domain death agonist isoform X2 [Hemicordylus capensis]XP_053107220.1 BH3-interacting domain death agonist isoform X2 [Hemicordylus capensis]